LLVADPVDPDALSIRWEIESAPSGSIATAPTVPIFIPDVRGEYRIDRYRVVGVSEDHTHRFVIMAGASRPVVIVTAEQFTVHVGDTIRLDGSRSYSPEHFPIMRVWGVVRTPRNLLGFPRFDPMIEFQAAAAGVYTLSLSVSDDHRATSREDISVTVVE
jgi:hypothetical protein